MSGDPCVDLVEHVVSTCFAAFDDEFFFKELRPGRSRGFLKPGKIAREEDDQEPPRDNNQ